jgi:hypothetical protein
MGKNTSKGHTSNYHESLSNTEHGASNFCLLPTSQSNCPSRRKETSRTTIGMLTTVWSIPFFFPDELQWKYVFDRFTIYSTLTKLTSLGLGCTTSTWWAALCALAGSGQPAQRLRNRGKVCPWRSLNVKRNKFTLGLFICRPVRFSSLDHKTGYDPSPNFRKPGKRDPSAVLKVVLADVASTWLVWLVIRPTWHWCGADVAIIYWKNIKNRGPTCQPQKK